MVIVTPSLRLAGLRDRPDLRSWLDRVLRQPASWYAGFAGYAACVALLTGPGLDRWWGTWAAGGYAVAAATAARWPSRDGQLAALGAAMAGALVAPLTWLATAEPSTPEVAVLARSGLLLLRHGTPYLAADQFAHGGWLAYNPYLPVMALFGVPKGLGLPGILADPRPWLAAATFALLYATLLITLRRVAACRVTISGTGSAQTPPGLATPGRGAAAALAAFAIASPVMAFPLAMGITDPPIIALTCLSLALLIRARASIWQPAVVLGIACAMKYTAWPGLAVIVVMLASRDGARAAVRFAAITLTTAVALAVTLAPAALSSPGSATLSIR